MLKVNTLIYIFCFLSIYIYILNDYQAKIMLLAILKYFLVVLLGKLYKI